MLFCGCSSIILKKSHGWEEEMATQAVCALGAFAPYCMKEEGSVKQTRCTRIPDRHSVSSSEKRLSPKRVTWAPQVDVEIGAQKRAIVALPSHSALWKPEKSECTSKRDQTPLNMKAYVCEAQNILVLLFSWMLPLLRLVRRIYAQYF
ncbi:MAG: hypothetical protein A2Y28_01770 [Chlamydiae bacterium GWC2_50_10]|nr:MAG: hypothetical protein A2Y28_01770 [Chlamydiae bacterium GWC2_50_10]OGN56148.1 MAG: hypothetical protein A2098_04725 [Chlamydiae bacterium GWF2_49_8]OGN58129.1 MAG: hypothetical protein A3D18_05785 [Chlamydiae bacterium RIFCSPHIGHO2_02_FULL_49_29]OGN69421.1 MAG: hypothetical protein A3I15_06080 [Chlamydiae bacterium RIFCSPLOWO2_02_FULL_49_12]HCJ83962.1 hypothetical protein [Parachlamydiales bacterium]